MEDHLKLFVDNNCITVFTVLYFAISKVSFPMSPSLWKCHDAAWREGMKFTKREPLSKIASDINTDVHVKWFPGGAMEVCSIF